MIIGFHAKAGGGKDECGKYLIEKYGFVKLSFAAPLKRMLAAMGFPEPATAEEKEAIIPLLGCSWRKLATTLGTEWGRHQVHSDLWTLLTESMVKEYPGVDFVVTDVRFENEASMIRRMQGAVIHLKGRSYAVSAETAAHASEAGIEIVEGDIVVHNDTEGIQHLRDKLDIALRMYL